MILFLPFMVLPLLACGQVLDQDAAALGKFKERMSQQIFKLKEGVLLVRLQTRQNSIHALKQGGLPKVAAQVDRDQKEFNKEVIAAFRKHFNFCPIYFFNSMYSDALLSKNFTSIVFFNDSLEPDSAIRPFINRFLVAEFNTLQQDTAIYNDGSYKYPGKNGLERRTAYRGGTNSQISSLRIMSEDLVQLTSPFPYYVRVYEVYQLDKRIGMAVKKMNEKLMLFYDEQR